MLQDVKRILFVGDSLTDGAAWPDWVTRTLKASGHPGLSHGNAAICGDTIAKVKARYTNDVLNLKPDLVVLCIGVNDTITKVPREQYVADMDEVLGNMRAAGIRVLLLTPPSLEKPEWNEELFARDPLLRKLAATHGCAVGELHRYFESSIKQGKRPWGDDGIHNSRDGWRAMGRCVLDSLDCTARMIEQSEPYPGAVTNWMVSPPIPWTTKDPIPSPDLAASFDPAQAGWKPFDRQAELKQANWWAVCWLERGDILPFGDPRKVKDSGVFALARIAAESDKRVMLAVGGSAPLAVWLNGTQVWCGTRSHGYHPNADRVPVTLRTGDNRLIVFTTWMANVSILP